MGISNFRSWFRKAEHLFPLFLVVSTTWLRAQSVGDSDVNIGFTTSNSVRDVQVETIEPVVNARPQIEADNAELKADQAQKNLLNDKLKSLQTPLSASAMSAKIQSTGDSAADIKKEITDRITATNIDLAKIGADILAIQARLASYMELVKGPEQDRNQYLILSRYRFTNNNSFIGKGVLATNQVDTGIDIQTPDGTEIIPYFSYAHGADKTSSTKMGSNLLGGTISLSQKFLPWVISDDHPKAYQPFSNDIAHPFPGYDFKAGLDVTFGNTNKFTYKSGAGSGYSQDQWTVLPSMTLDLYLSPSFSIALAPSYLYFTSTTDTGLSGSTGVFQFSDRNLYKINDNVQIYEVNALERDVNLEPQPPVTSDGYQTWAKFGAGINVKFSDELTFAAEYDYEAFNVSYQAHYVIATANWKFW